MTFNKEEKMIQADNRMTKKIFSREDIRDYKNGVKKGLIDGVINPRDVPPMYYEGFEFGKKLYRDVLDHCEKNGIKITKDKRDEV
jgi:hypothetical protein